MCQKIYAILLINLLAFSTFAKVTPQIQPISLELMMVKHQLGVAATGLFLLNQEDVVRSLNLNILKAHLDLTRVILANHDSAKINQTPAFLERYQLSSEEPSLAMKLSRFFGVDLKNPNSWPEGMTQVDVDEAFATIKKVNIIDEDWVSVQIMRYIKKQNLNPNIFIPLRKAISRLELVSDLINRQMLEQSLLRNFHLRYRKIPYLYEFGHPFKIDGAYTENWKGDSQAREIALQYVDSIDLLQDVAQATTLENIISRYELLTADSPYHQLNLNRQSIRELEIAAFRALHVELERKLRVIERKSTRQNTLPFLSPNTRQRSSAPPVCKFLFLSRA